MQTATALDLLTLLSDEMAKEAQTTRKMLARVPSEHFAWQPHAKSMTLKSLATHVAELPEWVAMGITTDGLDFAQNPYTPVDVASTGELLDYFEENIARGLQALRDADAGALSEDWILRNGDTVYQHYNRYEVIRMTFSQIVHHRAQLGVYLRLLDIPIPGSYGPSADENDFAK